MRSEVPHVKVRVVSGAEMQMHVSVNELIEILEDCFIKYSMGHTETPSRTVMTIRGNWWGVMQSWVPDRGVGVKIVSVIPSNRERGLPTIPGIVVYFDEETGLPKAIMDGATLTGLRTAAASSISIKYLKPADSGTLSIIGTGYQARFHLLFATKLFTIEKLKIYDISRKALESFRRFASELGFDAIICDELREANEDVDVIVETSTSEEPVVLGRYVNKPCHVVSIGAHKRTARALDDELLKKADLILVDSKKATYEETGDIYQPIENKVIGWNKILEVGEYLVNKERYARKATSITVYKSVGVAFMDTCAAYKIFNVCELRNVGSLVHL